MHLIIGNLDNNVHTKNVMVDPILMLTWLLIIVDFENPWKEVLYNALVLPKMLSLRLESRSI